MAKANVKVEARLYAAVSQVQSQEETRYYLCGVYVQPHPVKGALLVATDGHRMMVAHDPDGQCAKPVIVAMPAEAIKAITKNLLAKKSDESFSTIEVDSDGIASVGTFRSTGSVLINGTYPNWSKALPPILKNVKTRSYNKEVFAPASFNGDYIASFAKIASVLSRDGTRSIRVISHNEADAALVLFPNSPDVFGVLMPVHATVPGNAFPAFMKDVLEPAAPKKQKRAA